MIGRSGNRICVSFHRPITTLNFPKLWKRVGDDVISFSQTRKVGPSPISIIFRLINDTGVYLSIGDELILFWTFRKNGKIDRWLVDRHNRVRCYSGLWLDDGRNFSKLWKMWWRWRQLFPNSKSRPADEFDIQLFDVCFFSLKEVFQVSKEGPTSWRDLKRGTSSWNLVHS